MSKDYYNTLGVDMTANQNDIKKAFHKLAHKYHPDKKDGDEKKFKEINEAYQVLSNEKKRAQYDQFGSAGPGAGFGGQGFGGFDFSGFGGQNGNMQFDFGDLGDIFSAFGFNGGRRAPRGRDVEMVLRITFAESIDGITKKVSVPSLDGKTSKQVDVTIPPGIEAGQRLRVRGYGEEIQGGEAGDLYIRMAVEPDKNWQRSGLNLVQDISVKLTDAVFGAKYTIATYDKKDLSVKIPKGLVSGQVLRVRGKGVAGRGDILLRTQIVTPTKLSKNAKKALETLQKEGY